MFGGSHVIGVFGQVVNPEKISPYYSGNSSRKPPKVFFKGSEVALYVGGGGGGSWAYVGGIPELGRARLLGVEGSILITMVQKSTL